MVNLASSGDPAEAFSGDPAEASSGDPAERAILLLGAQRSGTTWLGKILDSHPDVLYRNEPDIGLPACPGLTGAALRATVNTWFGQTDLRTAGKRPLFRKSWQSAAAFGLRYGLVGLMTAGARSPVLGRLIARVPLPDLASAAGVSTCKPRRAALQNACMYLVTSTFSGNVPVCTEKSMNFWKSALSLAVRSPTM